MRFLLSPFIWAYRRIRGPGIFRPPPEVYRQCPGCGYRLTVEEIDGAVFPDCPQCETPLTFFR